MSTQAPAVISGAAIDWQTRLKIQRDRIRLGQYQRIGKLDALCFEVTALSNPKMLELGKQKTPDGRQAWPGKNLDWLGQGPAIAFAVDGNELLLPSQPFPLPPDCPEPTFVWKKPGDMPGRIKQLISDRAVVIKGTPFLCIQPVRSIQWMLDLAAPGRARREIHQVVADFQGLHMAFLYDPKAQTGHLVGGRVL